MLCVNKLIFSKRFYLVCKVNHITTEVIYFVNIANINFTAAIVHFSSQCRFSNTLGENI